MPLPHTIITLQSTDTVGISAPLTRSQTENRAIITALWQQFNTALHHIKNRPTTNDDWIKYGITYKHDGGHRYCAAVPYSPGMIVPETMEHTTLHPGHHIRFTHTGPVGNLGATYTDIYKNVLPRLNLQPAAYAEYIHFERYDNRFHWTRPDSEIDIYVPIKPDSTTEYHTNSTTYLHKNVTVSIDRPLGSRHPVHGHEYPVNYGFVPGTISGDGKELDAYILGITVPVSEFTGTCIAVIHRTNDNDDKLIVVPAGTALDDTAIRELTCFQEQYFTSCIIRNADT